MPYLLLFAAISLAAVHCNQALPEPGVLRTNWGSYDLKEQTQIQKKQAEEAAVKQIAKAEKFLAHFTKKASTGDEDPAPFNEAKLLLDKLKEKLPEQTPNLQLTHEDNAKSNAIYSLAASEEDKTASRQVTSFQDVLSSAEGDFKLSTALAERTATLNVTYGTEAQQVLFKAKKAYDVIAEANVRFQSGETCDATTVKLAAEKLKSLVVHQQALFAKAAKATNAEIKVLERMWCKSKNNTQSCNCSKHEPGGLGGPPEGPIKCHAGVGPMEAEIGIYSACNRKLKKMKGILSGKQEQLKELVAKRDQLRGQVIEIHAVELPPETPNTPRTHEAPTITGPTRDGMPLIELDALQETTTPAQSPSQQPTLAELKPMIEKMPEGGIQDSFEDEVKLDQSTAHLV